MCLADKWRSAVARSIICTDTYPHASYLLVIIPILRIRTLVLIITVSIDVLSVVRGDCTKVINDGYELHGKVHGDICGCKPDHIYCSVEEAGACTQFDYVVVSTENVPDVTRVEDLIAPVVTESETTVVMMQNGFDLGRSIIRQYPNNVCLYAVCHIGSHNNKGVITQDWKDKCVISYFINDNLDLQLLEKLCKDFIRLLAHPYYPLSGCQVVSL